MNVKPGPTVMVRQHRDAMLLDMRSLAARPSSGTLAQHIARFHYLESSFPDRLERILPNGRAHLMVNLAEDEFRTYSLRNPAQVSSHQGAVLAGPHAQPTVLDTREQRCLLAVEFRPGGAAPFFSLPICEMQNTVVSLSELWRQRGGLLRERLFQAATPAAMFRVLESVLLAQMNRPRDPAICYAVAALEHGTPVAEICDRLGLLPKTFVRRFRSQVGLEPKRYARVRRLQRTLKAAVSPARRDWCALAAEQGFADQAHMIRDFHDLTGITPAAYLAAGPERRNHVPIAVPAN
jgi:AraC-like DNA-binding protein